MSVANRNIAAARLAKNPSTASPKVGGEPQANPNACFCLCDDIPRFDHALAAIGGARGNRVSSPWSPGRSSDLSHRCLRRIPIAGMGALPRLLVDAALDTARMIVRRNLASSTLRFASLTTTYRVAPPA